MADDTPAGPPPAAPAPTPEQETTPGPAPAPGEPGRPWNWLGEARIALVFLTVLPVRLREADLRFGLSHGVRAFPLAGLAAGAVAAAAFVVADLCGLAPTISALLAIAAGALATGGLHEDGLADTADGMAGTRSRERRLEIMRDSRIGAHGALALLLATGLRAAAIAATGVALDTACAIVAAAIASRTAIAPVMYLLPPARTDGLSHAAGRPNRGRAADAVAIGVLLCALALAPVADPVRIILAMAGAAIGASLPALLARRRLGGQTGDVLGAVQQCAEIGFLLVFIADP